MDDPKRIQSVEDEQKRAQRETVDRLIKARSEYEPASYEPASYEPVLSAEFPQIKPVPKVNKAACFGAVLLVCILLGFVWFFTSTVVGNATAAASPQNLSTPQSEWRKGTVPALYQTDTAWAEHPYAGTRFSESGCGPICLTMVYIALTGDTAVSPTDVADLASNNGYADAAGTSWLFMSEGARMLGLGVQEFILSEELLQDYLAAGMPVICIMGEGDFTSSGHFIVITGRDDNGNYLVRDSNSIERTNQSWSFDTLYSQHLGAWAYDV